MRRILRRVPCAGLWPGPITSTRTVYDSAHARFHIVRADVSFKAFETVFARSGPQAALRRREERPDSPRRGRSCLRPCPSRPAIRGTDAKAGAAHPAPASRGPCRQSPASPPAAGSRTSTARRPRAPVSLIRPNEDEGQSAANEGVRPVLRRLSSGRSRPGASRRSGGTAPPISPMSRRASASPEPQAWQASGASVGERSLGPPPRRSRFGVAIPP